MINATNKEKAAAFEWLRDQAVRAAGCRHAAIMLQEVHRGATCFKDEDAKAVCDQMYANKVDDVIALCEALRALYALNGEDPQVQKIVDDAIEQHGVGNAG